MSEEVRNARTVVPEALVTSVCINGVLGFGMLDAILIPPWQHSRCSGPVDWFHIHRSLYASTEF